MDSKRPDRAKQEAVQPGPEGTRCRPTKKLRRSEKVSDSV